MTPANSNAGIIELIASPFARIAWTAAAVAVLMVVSMASAAPPLAMVLLSYLGPLAAMLWIVDDARQQRRTPCFDFGYFIMITYPFSLIWYCVSTRGWRGWLLVLAIMALVYVPYLVAAVAWAFLSIAMR